jgi:hypothetical protein
MKSDSARYIDSSELRGTSSISTSNISTNIGTSGTSSGTSTRSISTSDISTDTGTSDTSSSTRASSGHCHCH